MRSGSTRMYKGILAGRLDQKPSRLSDTRSRLASDLLIMPCFSIWVSEKKASRNAAHCLELIRGPQVGFIDNWGFTRRSEMCIDSNATSDQLGSKGGTQLSGNLQILDDPPKRVVEVGPVDLLPLTRWKAKLFASSVNHRWHALPIGPEQFLFTSLGAKSDSVDNGRSGHLESRY